VSTFTDTIFITDLLIGGVFTLQLRLSLALSLLVICINWQLMAADLLPRYHFINLATSDNSGINSLMQDDSGMIWAGGSNGLYRVQQNQLQPIRDLPAQTINQLLVIPGQGAWLGGSLGLWRWHRQTDSYQQQPCQPQGGIWQLLPLEHTSGALLALGPDGIWRVEPQQGHCTQEHISGLPAGAKIERLSIFQHRLIIAVREQGLFSCDLPCVQATPFAKTLHQVRFRQLLVHNDLLLAGSHKHGVYQLDGKGDVLRHWHKGDQQQLPVNGVMSLLPDRDQGYWVGLWAGGLVNISANGVKQSHSQFRSSDPTAISGKNIKTLLMTPDGTLYVGHENGVSTLLPGINQYAWIGQQHSEQPGLQQPNVQSLYSEQHGSIWIGTSGAGLYRFDPAVQRLQQFSPDPAADYPFPSNAVWAIRQDPDGSLVLGTSAGVVRLQPQNQQWQLLNGSLPSQDVFRLSIAPDRSIWISMWSGGIAQLTPEGKVSAIWRSKDGLQLDTNHALEISPAGVVFALNEAGLFRQQQSRFTAVSLFAQDLPLQLTSDRQGVIWLLTASGALWSWDDDQQQFSKLQQLDATNDIIQMFRADTTGSSHFWQLSHHQLTGFDGQGKLLRKIPLTGVASQTHINTAAVAGQQMIIGADDGLYIAPLTQQIPTPTMPKPKRFGMR
jgi:ligand-binding sensor domain-containing protein